MISGVEAVSAIFTELTRLEFSFSAITRLNYKILEVSKVLLVHLEVPFLLAVWCRSRNCDIYGVNRAGIQFFGHNSTKFQDITSIEGDPYTSLRAASFCSLVSKPYLRYLRS